MKKSQQYAKLIACAFVAVVLAACAKVTPETFAKVQSGMSKDEVKKILGSPTEEKSGGIGALSAGTYVYRVGNHEYIVSFMNEKVVTTMHRDL